MVEKYGWGRSGGGVVNSEKGDMWGWRRGVGWNRGGCGVEE